MEDASTATFGMWFLSSLLGGGLVAAAAYALLEKHLSKTFAKHEDLDGLGGRVTGAITVATGARERADANADSIIRLQESERHRWEPVAKALERFNDRMDKADQRGSRHAALLDEITRRLDHINGHRGAP